MCLTETFETVKEPVSFRQWSKISKPRKDGYGGVAVLYKDSDTGDILERKRDLEDEDVEVLCAKVTVSKDNYFLLVVSYIPPETRLGENSTPGIYLWNLPVFPGMANKAQVANTGK